MPSLNGINVKDAEFTAMQEKATALISKRSFVDNINFTSHLDIIKDQKTAIDGYFSGFTVAELSIKSHVDIETVK